MRTKSQPVPRGITAISTSVAAGDPVRDLVHGPVAADHDEQLRAAVRRLARERAELARRARRRACRPSSPRCAARCAISGQRLPGRAVVRRRVDEEDGVANEVAVASATRVIRSTAAFISSSEIRLNSPSTTMSLTTQQAARLDAAERADGEERRGLHLDREHAALRPALVLPVVRVVEEVARDDRADVHLLAHLLGDVDGAVDQLPARGRAVRLVADEVHRGRVGGDRGERDDHVAELVVRLQAAAGADAQQLLDAELDRAPRRRSSRPGSPSPCPGRRPASPPTCRCSRAGRARSSAGRRRRGRSRRCTSPAAGRPEGDTPRRTRPAPLARESASARHYRAGSGAWRTSSSRRSTRSSRYCAEDPVERVFLEDVARRGLGRFAGVEEDGRLVALCHTGANVVPSGRGCGAFADVDRPCRGADADRRAGRGERPLGGCAAAARAAGGPARAPSLDRVTSSR